MTIPLDQIYQEVILDHNHKPRNWRAMNDATHASHGYNPLCGDDYHLYLKVTPAGRVEDVSFQGSCCAISKASASILTQMVKGKDLAYAEDLKNRFVGMVTRDCVSDVKDRDILGSLAAFEGVRRFPVRVKCATLIWHTFDDALKQKMNGGQKP